MKESLFVAFVLLAVSWQKVSAETTFIVGPEWFDCYGPFLRKCLQVKEDPAESYRNFYDDIDGFDFESGYEYVLKVNAEAIENPPADGSAIKYTLLKEVSKSKV
ncbi:hypothetical protein HA402_010758 [Bradysia odoriphaga]|nr:hypothetical protein HA402_010758 [Bradysia odoriphaga]